jgi:hypothetical protein
MGAWAIHQFYQAHNSALTDPTFRTTSVYLISFTNVYVDVLLVVIKVNGVPIELIRVPFQGHRHEDPRPRRREDEAVTKALVAYYQMYVDEAAKEVKDIFGRTLLIADPRRCEPKKFGGRGARARFQKYHQSSIDKMYRVTYEI